MNTATELATATDHALSSLRPDTARRIAAAFAAGRVSLDVWTSHEYRDEDWVAGGRVRFDNMTPDECLRFGIKNGRWVLRYRRNTWTCSGRNISIAELERLAAR